LKIFVTGGAGYVGGSCLRYLLDQGHDAVAFDNLCEGHRDAVPARCLIEGELEDTAALRKAMIGHGSEAVMHFAAAAYVGESVSNPEYYYRNNICGTRSLLNAMREVGIKRMLFSSTCSTYGLSPECPMSEDSPQEPCNPYARTKLAVEWMIRDFAEAYNFGFTLLRYFNAAGASPGGEFGEDHNPEPHLIPLILEVPQGRREKLSIYGNDYPTPDGTCIRDYVHVNDLATAHLLAIKSTGPEKCEVFNVGTGNGTSVLEAVRACEDVTGTTIPIEFAKRRSGDPPALVADSSKLRTALGWQPQFTNIRDIVETAWQWHSTHPNGYTEI
jgi:UDP-glucose 4-epimerase